jgi:hypothetical protein
LQTTPETNINKLDFTNIKISWFAKDNVKRMRKKTKGISDKGLLFKIDNSENSIMNNRLKNSKRPQ